MPDLTLDWAWLSLQILLLGAVIALEVFRREYPNLYAILISLTFLGLVQGQAWWIFHRFSESGDFVLTQLFHTVTLEGARLANIYIGLGVFCFVFALWILPSHQPRSDYQIPQGLCPGPPTIMSYMLITSWTLGIGGLLIILLGGIGRVLMEPGQAVGGQASLLVALGLGKLPFLRKVAHGQRVGVLDLGLFAFVLFLTLFSSRILTLLVIFQWWLLLKYCRRVALRRGLAILVVTIVAILFVYGLFREYSGLGVDLETFQARLGGLSNRAVLDWFYALNVEGFVGIAGLLSAKASGERIGYDFGLSNLRLITLLIPNAIRNDPELPFARANQFLVESYPYPGSIVPPGVENAYAHWGLPGILAFGFLLGYIANWLHARATDRRPSAWRLVLLSVHVLPFVRGSFVAALYFLLGEIAMLWVFRVVLGLGMSWSKVAGMGSRRAPAR